MFKKSDILFQNQELFLEIKCDIKSTSVYYYYFIYYYYYYFLKIIYKVKLVSFFFFSSLVDVCPCLITDVLCTIDFQMVILEAGHNDSMIFCPAICSSLHLHWIYVLI